MSWFKVKLCLFAAVCMATGSEIQAGVLAGGAEAAVFFCLGFLISWLDQPKAKEERQEPEDLE